MIPVTEHDDELILAESTDDSAEAIEEATAAVRVGLLSQIMSEPAGPTKRRPRGRPWSGPVGDDGYRLAEGADA